MYVNINYEKSRGPWKLSGLNRFLSFTDSDLSSFHCIMFKIQSFFKHRTIHNATLQLAHRLVRLILFSVGIIYATQWLSVRHKIDSTFFKCLHASLGCKSLWYLLSSYFKRLSWYSAFGMIFPVSTLWIHTHLAVKDLTNSFSHCFHRTHK